MATPVARALLALALVGAFAGCATSTGSRDASADAAAHAAAMAPEPDEDDAVTTQRSGVAYATVAESFFTTSTPDENVDSPASWRASDGRTWLLATAKAGDRLLVYDGDTGRSLRRVGGPGAGAGQFRRPNGVFVVDDLVFVVERDNHRVQVLRLPGFAPLGHFGEQRLRLPYGLWVRPRDGGYDVHVTDAYPDADDDEALPPLDALGERVRRYRVVVHGDAIDARERGAYGDTTAAGAIRTPESIWGDPAHDRLLIAEEDQATGTRLRAYTLDGRYAGRDVGAGRFHAQAEGIALWQCADGSGWWIATDQYKDRSVFHLFDRETLAWRGAFAGTRVANTDGVWLQQAPTAAFPAGVFYAVDDDAAVAAFDWRRIARALGVRATCG